MKLAYGAAVVAALAVIATAPVGSAAEVTTEAVAAQDVESTLIKSVSYDPATQVLTLVFVKNDETYEYKNVPEDIYKGLMAAESKGSYFASDIKGKYEFVKK
ncbi:MAG: KTSC domain-containing protein [Lentisphaerota bacterium]